MIEFKRPETKECNSYYHKYVDLVEEGDIVKILKLTAFETIVLLEDLSEGQWNISYAQGKWSVKEAMIHLIDTERIMAYRALRFARNDNTELAGYDQDEYIPASDANNRTGSSIIEEYRAVRDASVQLFKNFPEPAWNKTGIANNAPVSVRALAYIIAGHELHHRNIFKTKYLLL